MGWGGGGVYIYIATLMNSRNLDRILGRFPNNDKYNSFIYSKHYNRMYTFMIRMVLTK